MSIDAIGNFLTIIRNGIATSKPFVVVPHSNMREQIAHLLLSEGFLRDVQVTEEQDKKKLKVYLKYVDGESVIHEIKRVSTPGRRMYTSVKTIKPVIGGLGVTILSTNKGIITHKQARTMLAGGEIICTVW